MRLWMGPKRGTYGTAGRTSFPGLGPNVVQVGNASVHGRDRGPDVGPDEYTYSPDQPGVWRSHRRRVDGQQYSRTSTPPARSRKHRKR